MPAHNEKYELHRLLGAPLSKQLSVEEKLTVIENEYDIPVEAGIRKEVVTMCNLSQGIKEDGIAIGEARIILHMSRNGFTAEQIAKATDKAVEEVQAIIEGGEPVLA